MKSIKIHLTSTLLLCILLPTGLIGTSAFWFVYDCIKGSRIADVGEVADARYESLHQQLLKDQQHTQTLLKGLLTDCRYSDNGFDTCAESKLKQFALINHTVGITLHSNIDTDLLIGSDAIPIKQFQQAFLPQQIAVLSKSPHDGSTLYSFFAQDTRSGFRLVTTYSAQTLQDIFSNSALLGASGETFLTDSHGMFVTQPRYPSEQGVIKPISAIPMQHCLAQENSQMLGLDYRNVHIIHGFRFVPDFGGGCIMAHISQTEAFIPLHNLTVNLTGIILLFICFSWIIAKRMANNLSNPLTALSEMAQALLEGNFNQRTFSTKYQEIAHLSRLFNQMAGDLHQTIQQLKASERDLEQKVIERTEQLEQRHRRYHSVIQTSGDGFWRVDNTGRLLEVNPAYLRLSGYSEAELLAMQITDLEAQETMPETLSHIEKIIQQGWDIFETRHRRKDGSVWDVEVNASYIANDGGYFVSFFRDISERHRLESLLKENEALLRNMMDASQAIIYMKDLSGRYIHINQCYKELFNLSAEMVLGNTDYDLFSPNIADEFRKNDLKVIESGQAIKVEEQARLADGSYHTYLSVKVPLRSVKNEIYATCGVSTDITERKQHEEQIRRLSDSELNKAKLEAERASQAKSDFLASMSHELFTPMNAVLGFAQVLEYEELTTEQHEYVEAILTGGYQLLDLIKEVLAFSIIESEKLALTIENLDLKDIIKSCLILMQSIAMKKGIKMTDNLTSACEVTIRADSLRIKQVLLNLLSNAIKYNKIDGGIHLSCEHINPQTIRIKVSDTGVGLSEIQLSKLFLPFERLSAKNSNIEGAGLGLCISKKLIEAMNGTIGAESTFGEGSCFWIEVPLAKDYF